MTQQPTKDWLQFEYEVRQLVEAFGYEAQTTQPSHDYGVDVIAFNQKRKVVIQCKLYGKKRIGGDTIMQLIGSCSYFEATDAICITTSYFTRQAREIAAKQKIHLIDREMLSKLCRERNLMVPSLTVLEIPGDRSFPVNSSRISIGRSEENDLIIRDPQVSRHHVVLEWDGLHLQLRDCLSTNGTFINGERLRESQQLSYEDGIQLGGFGPMFLRLRARS